MIREELLRDVVGHLLQLKPEDVTPATPLNGNLSGSIGRARLDAAVRSKIGIVIPEVYTVKTYGQLAGAICGSESDGSDAANDPPRSAEAEPARLAQTADHDVGIDIESVHSLQEETDFWDSPFYKSHFTQTEIGYCLMQPKPLETFAGLWSAKEALKKTSRRWVHLDWQAIEVAHDPDGSPYFVVQGGDLRPEYSLSISHTTEFSVAVVVRVSHLENERKALVTAPTSIPSKEKRSLAKSIGLVSLFSLAVLLISIWYIIHTHM
jgi:phosphopantetheine--protein transferase-like protein